MSDITINHIAGLEIGGHLARSVYAREVNFSTLALTVTNKQKTSNVCRLTISNTISPFLFVGQRINVNVSDSNFDVTGVGITAVDSANKWFEYPKIGSDVASSAASGTATPTYAFGLTGGNVFPVDNTIATAGDAGANLNKVQLAGRRGVYYTNLSNAVPGMADTITDTFALEITLRQPNFAGTTVDAGLLIRQTTGVNVGDCLIITFGNESSKYHKIQYYDFSINTITALVLNTHFTGIQTFTGLTTTNKVTPRVEFIKNGSGKLVNIRGSVGGGEFLNINLNSSWQMDFSFNIGDAAGQYYNIDTVAYKTITDLIKLLK